MLKKIKEQPSIIYWSPGGQYKQRFYFKKTSMNTQRQWNKKYKKFNSLETCHFWGVGWDQVKEQGGYNDYGVVKVYAWNPISKNTIKFFFFLSWGLEWSYYW